jgi:hypothetical protein
MRVVISDIESSRKAEGWLQDLPDGVPLAELFERDEKLKSLAPYIAQCKVNGKGVAVTPCNPAGEPFCTQGTCGKYVQKQMQNITNCNHVVCYAELIARLNSIPNSFIRIFP